MAIARQVLHGILFPPQLRMMGRYLLNILRTPYVLNVPTMQDSLRFVVFHVAAQLGQLDVHPRMVSSLHKLLNTKSLTLDPQMADRIKTLLHTVHSNTI